MSDRAETRPIVVVSNRGPVTFAVDPEACDGVTARRGAGGLVSGLGASGAALILAARWGLRTRLLLALAVVATAVLAMAQLQA